MPEFCFKWTLSSLAFLRARVNNMRLERELVETSLWKACNVITETWTKEWVVKLDDLWIPPTLNVYSSVVLRLFLPGIIIHMRKMVFRFQQNFTKHGRKPFIKLPHLEQSLKYLKVKSCKCCPHYLKNRTRRVNKKVDDFRIIFVVVFVSCVSSTCVVKELVSILQCWFLPHFLVICNPGPGSYPQDTDASVSSRHIWIQTIYVDQGSPEVQLYYKNIKEQPLTRSQKNSVLINICCNRKEYYLNLSLFEHFFTPFLICLYLLQVFESLEDKNHAYFITFPHILEQHMPGALPGNEVVNIIDI